MFQLVYFLVLLQTPNPLSIYKWEKRVVLVSSVDENMLEKQLTAFNDQHSEISDRDIVLISLSKGTVQVEGKPSDHSPIELQKAYGLNNRNFAVILIGKDGGEKFRSSSFVRPFEVFGLIDQMPMRKSEIRSKR